MSTQTLLLALAAVLTIGATDSAAQQPFTIKGHALGESINAYIHQLPDGQQKLQTCRENITNYDLPNYSWCYHIIAAVDKGSRVNVVFTEKEKVVADVSYLSGPDYGILIFDGGKLVEIKLHKKDADYLEMMIDVKNRLGEPSKVGDSVYQSGYGATFHYPSAMWVKPNVVATLQKLHEFDTDFVELTVETSAEAAHEMAEKKRNHVDTLK